MDKMHEIRFETKEQANERRLSEALERTPHERLIFFLKLCDEMQLFYKGESHPNRAKNNFILE